MSKNYIMQLEALERMIDTLLVENKNKIEFNKANNYDCELLEERRKDLENYKQSLIKAQKEHKALEIIKEKDVDIYILTKCKTVDEYNSKIVHIIGEIRELTYEEFELLKEVLE